MKRHSEIFKNILLSKQLLKMYSHPSSPSLGPPPPSLPGNPWGPVSTDSPAYAILYVGLFLALRTTTLHAQLYIPEHANLSPEEIDFRKNRKYFPFFRFLKINQIVHIHCLNMLIVFGVIRKLHLLFITKLIYFYNFKITAHLVRSFWHQN